MTTNETNVAKPPIWNLPHQRNAFFTGREEVLSLLEQSLYTDKLTCLVQPLAFRGLGGIGKTQTAIEYAYRHMKEYQAVLWVRADSYPVLLTEFANLATLLQLPERYQSNQRVVVAAVMRWLRDHDQWLLIFDNVEDMNAVNTFIPTATRGHILLTTRSQATGQIAQPIEIEKMSVDVGALLLLRRANLLSLTASLDDASAENRHLASEITRLLDGLPLALSQAGAYIQETPCTLAAYIDLFQTRQADLLQQRGSFDENYPASVATTWSLSFEKVLRANPAAAELLHLFVFLYSEAIPEEILTEASLHLGDTLEPVATDSLLLEATFKELLRFSLLDRDSDTATFSIHRLVQVIFKDSMNKDVQMLWAIRTVQAVNEVFPGVDFSTWPRCQRYVLHARTCAALIDEWNLVFPNAARLLNQTGAYLRIRAQYTEAEPLYKKALAIWEETLGPEHSNTAACLNNLALLYEKLAKYEEAESLYQRALAIWQKILDPFDPTLAICLNNLAQLYRFQGKYEQAEPLYQQSLAIRKQVWGMQHESTATAYHNLATMYDEQGKYEQAEPLYQQALAIREQTLDAAHPDISATLNSIAILYHEQGKYKEAESLLQRSIAMHEKIFGPDHVETLTGLNNLALIYKDQGQFEQAELLYRRVLSIREQRMGSAHPDVADSLNNLASLYSTQGKYPLAEEYYQRALAIYERTPGHLHYRTASCLNNLAELYRLQESFDKAEPLYMEALAIWEQVLGKDHPKTASTLSNMALLYQEQGFYDKAEQLHQQALAIREQKCGTNHPSTMNSLHNIASLYRVQKKFEQAEKLYQRVLEQYQHTKEPGHPDITHTLHNLALLYTDWERYDQAEELYKQALTDWTQKFGSDHPQIRTILNNYTHLLWKMGRDTEAAALIAPYTHTLVSPSKISIEEQVDDST